MSLLFLEMESRRVKRGRFLKEEKGYCLSAVEPSQPNNSNLYKGKRKRSEEEGEALLI